MGDDFTKHYKTILPDDVLSELLKDIKVLVVEDHPIVQEQLVKALQIVEKKYSQYCFLIDTAKDIEEAYNKISLTLKNKAEQYGLILLDIKLPEYKAQNMLSGEDLGKWIKIKVKPNPSIIVTTSYTDGYRILNIVKTIDPDGLIVKSNITNNTLIEAIHQSLIDPPYYSSTVNKKIRNEVASNKGLDDLDRKILHLIANGANMKDLVELLPKSKSTIEKRKKKLMDFFNVKSYSNFDLITIAKEKNYL
ncbi:response regulator [Pontimicrobium sp. MEBiC06410]